MQYSSRKALESVIERAGRLSRSPRLKETLALEIRWEPPNPPQFTGDDQASVDISVRTARLFLKGSAELSLDAVRKTVADDPDVSDACKRDCARLWRKLDAALASAPTLRVSAKGQTPPTKWELLRLLLFGDLEHVDPAERELVHTWLAQPTTALLLRSQFQTALITVCDAVMELKKICERELLRAASS